MHEGPALTRALKRIVGALAAAAVRMQLAEEAASTAAEPAKDACGAPWGPGTTVPGGTQGSWPPAEASDGAAQSGAASWALLRALLDRYRSGRGRGAAANGIRGGVDVGGSGSAGAAGPAAAGAEVEQRGGQLLLSAAEAALAADRRVRLPAWLRALYQARVQPSQGGKASRAVPAVRAGSCKKSPCSVLAEEHGGLHSRVTNER